MSQRSRSTHRRAFTLIETLVVVVLLGVLAAVVVPKYIDMSDATNEATLRAQLKRVRTEIELFRARNGDDPTLVSNQWSDLVDNEYLLSEPKNPLNGSTQIATAPADGVGWIWRDKGNGTMHLFATDSSFSGEWNEGS